MSVFVVPKNLFRRTVRLNWTQTPTLIGCMFLTNLPARQLPLPRFVCLAAISEALNYDTNLVPCPNILKIFSLQSSWTSPLATGATPLQGRLKAKGKPRLCDLAERGLPV